MHAYAHAGPFTSWRGIFRAKKNNHCHASLRGEATDPNRDNSETYIPTIIHRHDWTVHVLLVLPGSYPGSAYGPGSPTTDTVSMLRAYVASVPCTTKKKKKKKQVRQSCSMHEGDIISSGQQHLRIHPDCIFCEEIHSSISPNTASCSSISLTHSFLLRSFLLHDTSHSRDSPTDACLQSNKCLSPLTHQLNLVVARHPNYW